MINESIQFEPSFASRGDKAIMATLKATECPSNLTGKYDKVYKID